MEDFSALRCVRDLALAQERGIEIDLIPQLDDPKNLYALVKPAAKAALALAKKPTTAQQADIVAA